MEQMNITSAQYKNDTLTGEENAYIEAVIDGETSSVPLDTANRHYAEILRQVAEGTLTIADAD
ncbi:tail assembly chaperone [Methylophilales phage Melnitz EXVC044M]|nr:tail assembly chaperone [Methylophilales phage Melnitz-1 EXVC043M]QZI94682.1 tail assembly chaperone [Methylophilales phage Melnitz-2 EXVC040M]QZI94904.1 tail assembly chaperone [Methylophilales phage Melnitz EXVC044M]